MNKSNQIKPIQTMEQRVAEATRAFQQQLTGHSPKSVTVVLSDDTMDVTLHESLSPAEVTLAQTPDGAAQVQQYHRQLFESSADAISIPASRTATPVIRPISCRRTVSGGVVHAFTSGTIDSTATSPPRPGEGRASRLNKGRFVMLVLSGKQRNPMSPDVLATPDLS